MRKRSFVVFVTIAYMFLCFGQSVELIAMDGEYEKILLRSGESNPDSTQVLCASDKGVFLLRKGRELITVEKSVDIAPVIFPDDLYIEDAVFGALGLFVKNGEVIYLCRDKIFPFFRFDSSNFMLDPTGDGNLFIIVNNDSQGVLYYLDCESREVRTLAAFPETIVNAFGTKDESIVVTNSGIYFLAENKAQQLLSYYEPITSASYADGALFFSTKNNLLLLVDNDMVGVVFDDGCKQLAYAKGFLYVYNDDGSLVCYPAILKKEEAENLIE